MPLTVPCLDCGCLIERPIRGRCLSCRKEQNSNDFYQTKKWRRQRRKVKAKTCDICPSTERLTAHHSKPRSEGGSDAPENLKVTLCGKDHSQYEADKRAGKDTELVRLVDALGGKK